MQETWTLKHVYPIQTNKIGLLLTRNEKKLKYNFTNYRKAASNRRLSKKRVQCLNKTLYFVYISRIAGNLVLRDPLLHQVSNR
jgi:hypothetical protein